MIRARLTTSIISLLLLTAVSTASADTTDGGSVGPIVNVTCPKPSQLIKQQSTSRYHYSNDWKSYEQSFVTKVTRFLGAQWQGITFGHIVCIYRGEPLDSTFPIEVYFNRLAVEPKGGAWKTAKGDIQNCKSSKVTDCPIQYHGKAKQKDIYQQVEELKTNTTKPEYLQAF